MKKIINNVLWLMAASIIITSCGKKDAQQETATATTIPAPQVVVGIGKVLPEDGLALLSVTQSNKVTKVYKKVGDTVAVGDKLFDMESTEEQLQLDAANAALSTAQANAKVSGFDIKTATLKLKELEHEYLVSKRLVAQRAETQQKLAQDSIAYMQQRVLVDQYRQSLAAQQAQVREQQAQVKSNATRVGKQSFKALQAGVLTRFDVVVGAVLTTTTTFGELAPLGKLVIEGEIDELYANKIKEGQKVDIVLVGQTTVIASGSIQNVGAGLQNKSIIYETVGEANDRRVRRFTVTIDNKTEPLLINQKVECKIKL